MPLAADLDAFRGLQLLNFDFPLMEQAIFKKNTAARPTRGSGFGKPQRNVAQFAVPCNGDGLQSALPFMLALLPQGSRNIVKSHDGRANDPQDLQQRLRRCDGPSA